MERGTMSEYILILLWVGIMAVVVDMSRPYRMEKVLGSHTRRISPFVAILVFAPIVWMAATRGYFADTGAYLSSFSKMPNTFSEFPGYMAGVKKDKGFYALSAIIKILGANNTCYLFVIALIQAIILVAVYRKYTEHYVMAVFLFVVSSDYISWMFNGIRQFIAVVIIFAITGLIVKKKYIPAIIAILIASTMHQSALLMIPLMFIVQGKAWNKKTILFLLGVIVAVSFVDQFTDILDSAMQETQYANMVTDWTEWQDDGTNPLRVLVYSVPMLMSLIGIKYIREANDPLINFCTNMSIYVSGMYLVSMFTSGIFLGRLPIYGSLLNYILLPWEIEHMFTKDSARIVKVCMIGAYLIFYIYQMHFIWGLV